MLDKLGWMLSKLSVARTSAAGNSVEMHVNALDSSRPFTIASRDDRRTKLGSFYTKTGSMTTKSS
jgi:hypothetical protein